MKLLLTLSLLLFSSVLTAPPNSVMTIAVGTGVKDQTLLNAIMSIETIDQNPLTVNWRELAHGILQIRPCMITEANRILKLQGKTERYTIVDALDRDKSIEIFWIIQGYYNPTNDLFLGAVVWNGRSKENLYFGKILAKL